MDCLLSRKLSPIFICKDFFVLFIARFDSVFNDLDILAFPQLNLILIRVVLYGLYYQKSEVYLHAKVDSLKFSKIWLYLFYCFFNF